MNDRDLRARESGMDTRFRELGEVVELPAAGRSVAQRLRAFPSAIAASKTVLASVPSHRKMT